MNNVCLPSVARDSELLRSKYMSSFNYDTFNRLHGAGFTCSDDKEITCFNVIPRIITTFMKAVNGSNISHLNPFPSSLITFPKRISTVLDNLYLDLARDPLS